ncbi:MAG: hypothetical protein AAGM22_30415 [Acidobacteriota bacterium]
MQTCRLTYVSPVSAGILAGGVAAIFALITSLIGLVFSGLGANMFGLGGFVAILILPVVQGFFGFLGGLIGAFVYNLAADSLGGVEIRLEGGFAGSIGDYENDLE